MTLQELAAWQSHFDTNQYSTQVYEDLVVRGNDHPEKFSIMGAWKAGNSLQRHPRGLAYTDSQGETYTYSKRWKNDAPVGKYTWEYINENRAAIKTQVPASFPDSKPAILKELQQKQGFGFIWSLFTLHCVYPEVYPLYDQHVYRAYKRYTARDERPYLSAPDDWKEYSRYRTFFLESIHVLNMPYWQFDRALWAYGKSIKQPRMKTHKIPVVIPSDSGNESSVDKASKKLMKKVAITSDSENACPGRFPWKHEATLGHGNHFCWRIDENNSLHIARKFVNDMQWRIGTFTEEEINMIQQYMEPIRWAALANNVQKLANGTEREGLGKFIYSEIDSKTTTAQLSSHMGALFYKAGIWEWNGQQTGMQFQKIPNANWQQKLTERYNA